MSEEIINVLLVEDNPIDIEAAKRELRKSARQIEVSSASCLAEAVDLLDSNSAISIVVLDLGLPDGAGLQSVRAIRSANEDVPLIVLTRWDEAFAQKIMDAGANGYLSKDDIGNQGLELAICKAIKKVDGSLSVVPITTGPSAAESAPLEMPRKPTIDERRFELSELVTKLRLGCSDLLLNNPDLRDVTELQEIVQAAKRINEIVEGL